MCIPWVFREWYYTSVLLHIPLLYISMCSRTGIAKYSHTCIPIIGLISLFNLSLCFENVVTAALPSLYLGLWRHIQENTEGPAESKILWSEIMFIPAFPIISIAHSSPSGECTYTVPRRPYIPHPLPHVALYALMLTNKVSIERYGFVLFNDTWSQ